MYISRYSKFAQPVCRGCAGWESYLRHHSRSSPAAGLSSGAHLKRVSRWDQRPSRHSTAAGPGPPGTQRAVPSLPVPRWAYTPCREIQLLESDFEVKADLIAFPSPISQIWLSIEHLLAKVDVARFLFRGRIQISAYPL